MSKVTTKCGCNCGMKTEVVIKKPSHFEPSFGTFTCDGCESKLKYFIKKGRKKGEVFIETNIVKMSDELQLIIMEEQQNKLAAEHEPVA